MMTIKDDNTYNYYGGATLTAAFLNAINSIVKTIYSIGQSFGSSIYRKINKISC